MSLLFRSYLTVFGLLLAPSCVSWEISDVDGDGVLASDGDCNDLNAGSFPGASEVWYDGEDQNCDGNDGDQDGDGWLEQDYEFSDKYPSEFGVGDCDDVAFDVNPDAAEIWYDGVDGDCDGESDFDQDGDGEDSESDPDLDSNVGLDCDDLDATINTSATEIWYDGVDQNCDDWSDYDQDGDGFDSESEAGGLDCIDGADGDDSTARELDEAGLTASDVNPAATEVWYDGIDQDCDDESDYDQDGDGYDSSIEFDGGLDCDDLDPAIGGEDEIWYNGIDENCDYNDGDQDFDGYVVEGYVYISLFPGDLGQDDCDDELSNVFPDAIEDCDTIYDDNCNDELNELNANNAVTLYADNDEDDFGSSASALFCEPIVYSGVSYIVDNTDCDDSADTTYPGAAHNEPSLCTMDLDSDGWGSDTVPNGVDAGTDCDDSDAFYTPEDEDGDGLTTCDTDLDDSNGLPSITGVSIDPASPEVTDTLTCSVVGWDDGDATANGDTDQSTFVWKKDGSAVGTGSTLALSSYAYGDVLSCTGTPYDGTQAGTSASDSVTIQNSVPTVSISSPTSGGLTHEGDDVSFGAVVSDSDQVASLLTIDWSSSIDGSFSSEIANSNGIATFTESGLTSGTHTLTVTVTDDAGATATDTVSFIVNGLPTQPNVSISPTTAYVDDDLVATATGSSDTEGDTITYSYAWTRDGSTSGYTSSTIPESATTSGETWVVVVTPTDPDGGVGPIGGAQVIVQNTPPVISGPSVTPSSGVTTTTMLTCAATATDIDGDTPTITYLWTNVNTGASLGTNDSLKLTTSTASPSDSIVCLAVATDNEGETDFASASVSVENTAPVLSAVSVSPASGVTTSSTVACSATATDADGGSPTVSYEWTNGSTTLGTSASLTLTPSTSAPSDTITCTATATDADGGTDNGSDSATVENTRPVVASVTISPATGVKVDSTISCVVVATDADGGTPSVAYDWKNGGTTIGTSASITLSLSTVTKGDTVSCVVTVTDGDGGSDTGNDSILVENSVPVVSAVTLSPDPGFEGSTLTCAATPATDTDGDTIQYSFEWNVGGVVSAGTDTLTGSDFDKGDTVYCTATPNDGEVDGSPRNSNSVLIENTPPVAPVAAITSASSPTAPEAGVDDIICEVDTPATDDDSVDTLTYTVSWTLDGSAWTGATYTTTETDDTIDGGDTNASQLWECSITVDDGTDSAVGTASTYTSLSTPSGAVMVFIPSGTYDMGCDGSGCTSSSSNGSDNSVVHSVTLTNDFYMSETEVTQAQYQSIVGTNPSSDTGCGTDCPVENVTWNEAAEYANALSASEGLTSCFTCASGTCSTPSSPYTCDGYRLPTEAEWEYAAAGGESYRYSGSDTIGDVAVNNTNAIEPVAGLQANGFGLYDMSGNVFELMWDWYDAYSSGAAVDPEGPISGPKRVERGGSYDESADRLEVSYRHDETPTHSHDDLGFRLVQTAP